MEIEWREGKGWREGGGVESRNSAMKTPTHLPTHTYTEMTQRKAVEGKTHKRIRDNSLPSLLSETLDTHTQTHTVQKNRRCQDTKKSVFQSTLIQKRQQKRSLTKPERDVLTHSALLFETCYTHACTEDGTN